MICDVPRDHLLDWNGSDIPEKLRELPAGRYVIAAVDETPTLTDDEEAGLEAALQSVGQGRKEPHGQVLARAWKLLKG